MVDFSAIIHYCGATKRWYGGFLALCHGSPSAIDATDVNKEDGKQGIGTTMD
jgi:hypothetical protein